MNWWEWLYYCFWLFGNRKNFVSIFGDWRKMWLDDDDYFFYLFYYFGLDMDDSDDVYCGYSSGEDLYMIVLCDLSWIEIIGGLILSVEVVF